MPYESPENPQENQDEVLTNVIKSAGSFTELYARLDEVAESDSSFSATDIRRHIRELEQVASPSLLDTPVSQTLLRTITRKYGLREKVIELIKALPERPPIEQNPNQPQSPDDGDYEGKSAQF